MIIQSKKVWIANGFMPAQLEIRDGKIVQIYDHGTKEADEDYGELRIVPGFIDVHTHGLLHNQFYYKIFDNQSSYT